MIHIRKQVNEERNYNCTFQSLVSKSTRSLAKILKVLIGMEMIVNYFVGDEWHENTACIYFYWTEDWALCGDR